MKRTYSRFTNSDIDGNNMILFTLTVIFIVDGTHSHHPTSVNLQMEASLVVEPDDILRSPNILRQVQDYMHKIFDYSKNMRSNLEGNNVFGNFFKELVKSLDNYEEDTLRGLARQLYFEVAKFQDSQLASLLSPRLKEILLTTLQTLAFFKPVRLKYIVRKLKNRDFSQNPVIKKFKVYFNGNDKEYLDEIVNKFKRNDLGDVSQTIHNALKYIVFDRFEKIPASEKLELYKELNMFAELLPNINLYNSKNFKSLRKSGGVEDEIQMNNDKENTKKDNKKHVGDSKLEVRNDTYPNLSVFF